MAISENGDTLTYQNDLGQPKEAVGVVVLNSIGGGAVDSVNGQTGEVVLAAADVGALPDTYTPTWGQVTGKPAVIAAGTDAGAARAAIGAGTSNLVIGTTASTALAGNTVIPPAATWATLSGKPAVIAAGADAADARTAIGLGTAATQASTAFATAAQGTLAATALQPADLSFAAVSALEGDWRGQGVETLGAALLALQAAIVP